MKLFGFACSVTVCSLAIIISLFACFHLPVNAREQFLVYLAQFIQQLLENNGQFISDANN